MVRCLAMAVVGLAVCSWPSAAQTKESAGSTGAPAPRADEGRKFWTGANASCWRCHGPNGEGGFGPDLAGRGLSFEQVRKAAREPWGIMPRYGERYLSDQTVADLAAFFASMPKVPQPGPWRAARPTDAAAEGDRVMTITAGCNQCHDNAEVGINMSPPSPAERVGSWRLSGIRAFLGANLDNDYEWFKTNVYEHDKTFPNGRMGSFSRDRLPEPLLREAWRWLTEDLGRQPRMRAEITAGAATTGNTTYTITVRNSGVPGKGLSAEGLTLTVPLPSDVHLVSASRTGYQGLGQAANGLEVATWTMSRLEPGDKETFTVTVSGSATAAGLAQTALVGWQRPKVAGAERDAVRVALAPPAATSR